MERSLACSLTLVGPRLLGDLEQVTTPFWAAVIPKACANAKILNFAEKLRTGRSPWGRSAEVIWS